MHVVSLSVAAHSGEHMLSSLTSIIAGCECTGLAEGQLRCVQWLLLHTCRKHAPRAVSDGSASLMPE